MHVFCRPLEGFIPSRVIPPEFEFKFLSDELLESDSSLTDDFRKRQEQRLERFGENFSYGFVEINSKRIASLVWLIPYTHMHLDQPNMIRPLPGDVELTGAETQPEFRGQGLYATLIDQSTHLMSKKGFKNLWIKTNSTNSAALASFAKLDMKHIGDVRMLRIPGTSKVFAGSIKSKS